MSHFFPFLKCLYLLHVLGYSLFMFAVRVYEPLLDFVFSCFGDTVLAVTSIPIEFIFLRNKKMESKIDLKYIKRFSFCALSSTSYPNILFMHALDPLHVMHYSF